MTETHSKSRHQADVSFGATHLQFFAQGHAVEELNSIVQAREDKTLRLREARMAKALADRTSVTTALVKRRAKTA